MKPLPSSTGFEADSASAFTNTAAHAVAGAPDFSILALFGQADVFVKLIMLLLLAMSVISWTIWFAKSAQFKSLKRKANQFEKAFWQNEDGLEDLYRGADVSEADHPMAKVYVMGLKEWENHKENIADEERSDALIHISATDRIRQLMGVTMMREMEILEKYLPVLATVGSTAPFIGLLGTVWGIMNSFTSIGASKNTSLAVVAPGIAEALLATALGLFAAIPAVMAYNKFSTDLGRYANRMEAFLTEFLSLIERQEAQERRAERMGKKAKEKVAKSA